MVGSRPVTSGLGSTRLNLIQDSHTRNTPGRSGMDTRNDYGVSMRGAVVGVGAMDSVQPGTVPPSQRTHTVLQPDGVHPRVTGVGGIESGQPGSVQPSLQDIQYN